MRAAATASDDIAFMRLDDRFNRLFTKTARNEYAARAMALMQGLSRRFWYQHYRQVGDMPLAAKLHADVAEAIAERRTVDAEAASDRLVAYIESVARKTLDT